VTGPSHPPAPAVEVRVEHRVGDHHLRLDLQAGPGITVLMGPSGAGKSLALSIIAGLVRPERGTVRIAGRTVADPARGLHVATQVRRVGMVFQHGVLLPHRDVLDNVALAVRGGTRHRRRTVAAGWLARVGAADLAARRPAGLSGGERQRVALARALAGSPRLLLLDEPFSALDRATRSGLRALVRREVEATGVPALFVTHDAEEAEEVGDRLVMIEAGRVLATRTLR